MESGSSSIAFRPGRGVEDAKLFILNTLYRYLEGLHTHAKILFAGFSSAFNTMQPHLLAHKLLSNFGLKNRIVLWIMSFLTNRLQKVFVNGHFSVVSDMYWISAGLCPFATSVYSLH